MFLELPNMNVPSKCERVQACGQGEGAVGKSSVVGRRETRRKGKSKMGRREQSCQ